MEEEKLQRAKKRAKRLRKFYSHLATYVIVNIILVIINLVTSPNSLWFYWVIFGWGIAVIIDAASTFTTGVLTEDWEERKAKEIMEKEERKSEKE